MAEGAPTKNCSNPEACFLFRSPPHYTAYLKDAGFDALSLANKHARDFGEEGRTASRARGNARAKSTGALQRPTDRL